jgi:Ca-activated chloride channel homolog
VPLGVTRGGDVSLQKLGMPNQLKKGQTFDVKIFVNSDEEQEATLRLYRNEQYLGEQKVQLAAGKNLFTFPQTLEQPGFYSYSVAVEAAGDKLPQNNKALGFANVRGDPRVLVVSAEPSQDATLVAALRQSQLDVKAGGLEVFPPTLAEMQSFDTIFISNIAAGDLGEDMMKLLESAVRDFGVGLVCVGGDQTYAAGGYRGTPLEAALPLDMELDSKKVLPKGALALLMHGMEFDNGNEVARQIAQAALDALGPQDELGVLLWDGNERWLFPLTVVGDKKDLRKRIAGMNQGDLPSFQNLMTMGLEGLKKSGANLKHMIILSDGDPAPPSDALMADFNTSRVTVSTVMIGGHVMPDTMIKIAEQGRGRFYDVKSAGQLPQIFIKETAVILKAAIHEEPFKPQLAVSSELVRGIGAAEYPQLLGYVATSSKPRAEVPLVSDKGDPVLAHWQYGLGRAAAFTSDAKARWAQNWLGWGRYRQFWSQVAQWSLRRLENADYTTEVSIDRGEGVVSVEAVDDKGEYRNFLNLQTVVVSPTGERQTVRLEQTGPGRYEAKFPTREVGGYLMNIMEVKDGKLAGAQVIGASVNHSPEFSTAEPNTHLLRRLAEAGGGKVLNPALPADNPFLLNRQKTFQPRDLWEWLLKLAILLFPLDVAIRRIQLDREEWAKATATLRRWIMLGKSAPRPTEADESLNALLARRSQVRETRTKAAPKEDLFQPEKPVVVETSKPAPLPVAGPGGETTPAEPSKNKAAAGQEAGVTDRLLEAKRRAQRRK